METKPVLSDEAKKKLESSSAHTKAVLDHTGKAAKEVSETVKKHAQEVIDTGREHLTAAAKDLGDAASVTVEDLKGHATTAWDQATSQARNLQSQTEDYIRTQPLQAIGIAFAVGILFGLIARR